MQVYDFAICGNGIIALAIAYALTEKEPNLKIAVIGPSHKPGSASLAAGAMLGCFGEVSQVSLTTEAGLAKLNMAFESKKLWPQWIDQINNRSNDSNKIRLNKGTYIILNARSGPLDDRRFNNIILALNKFSEPYHEVNWQDIDGLKPVGDCRPFKTIYLPEEGAVDPATLLNSLQSMLENNANVTFIQDYVESIKANSHKITQINLKENGNISSGGVIIAAGAYSQAILDQVPSLSNKIPRLLSAVGCAVKFKHNQIFNKGVIRTPNRAGACGLHAVSHKNGETYVGATNYVTLMPETRPRGQHASYLLQYALEQVNHEFHHASISEWYIGNRPMSLDTYPLIGPTSLDNLWLATGTYRDGLHNSPLIGQQLANLIFNKISSLNPIFYPERKPIEFLDKEQASAEFAYQAMSTGYEHSIQWPRIGWHELFKEMFNERIKKIYNKFGLNYGLPVEILLFLDRNQNLIDQFRSYYTSPTIVKKILAHEI